MSENHLLEVGQNIYELPSHLSPNEPIIKYTVFRVTATKAEARSANGSTLELKRSYNGESVQRFNKSTFSVGSRRWLQIETAELIARFEREALEGLTLSLINATAIKKLQNETLQAINELVKKQPKGKG